MKIALTLVASLLLSCSLTVHASDNATLSISGQVVESGFTVTSDGLRVVPRGASTQTVPLPGDESRKVVITAWD